MKTLKMKSLKNSLGGLLVFLAISVVLLIFVIPSVLLKIQGPEDLDTFDYARLTQEDFKQAYVAGTIYGIYDYYCDETTDGELSAREYLIDGGDYYYIGLRVKDEDMGPAEALMHASYDYLDGIDDGTALEAAQYEVEGTIKPMDEESIRILKEYLDWNTMDAETQATFLFYYLEVNEIGNYDMGGMIVLLVVSGVCLLIFIIMLIRILTGACQKQVKKYIEGTASPESTREKVEHFINSTQPVYGLYYNNQYICGQVGGTTFFKETPQLVWAYQSTTAHKYFYVITISKSYALTLGFADGSRYSMAVKKEAQVQELMAKLGEICPQLILGYSPELDAMFRKNLPGFLELKYSKTNTEQAVYESNWQH